MDSILKMDYYNCITVATAVECYICSWNPGDYKNGNYEHSDVCSAGHFDPERVRTHDCSRGCEIVSMKDPNGRLCNVPNNYIYFTIAFKIKCIFTQWSPINHKILQVKKITSNLYKMLIYLKLFSNYY